MNINNDGSSKLYINENKNISLISRIRIFENFQILLNQDSLWYERINYLKLKPEIQNAILEH